jgi:predicted acylesterase/phospholipase RssA
MTSFTSRSGVQAGSLPCADDDDDAFDAIVLSGGGMQGCASIGAVAELQSAGALRSVTICAGSSVGSVVAAIVALDKPIAETFSTTIACHKFVPNINIGNLDKTFGIDSGTGLRALIDSVIGKPITFQGIQEHTGKTLVVVATELNSHRPVYFSPITSPTMDVALAIHMSCSVPLMFSAVHHDGKLYCDAAVTDNFPMEYVVDVLGAKNPIGINFAVGQRKPHASWTFGAFIGAVISSSIAKYSVAACTHSNGGAVLTLDTGPRAASAFDFKMSRADREALYGIGRTHGTSFLNSKKLKERKNAESSKQGSC